MVNAYKCVAISVCLRLVVVKPGLETRLDFEFVLIKKATGRGFFLIRYT